MTTPNYVTFSAAMRASRKVRSVTVLKDLPNGLADKDDVIYAQNKTKIYIPKPGDATKAAAFDFDRQLFDEFFSTAVAAVPVTVDKAILTYAPFTDQVKSDLGVRDVVAIKDSPIGLFVATDTVWALNRIAIFIVDPLNDQQACRFDFDASIFHLYFREPDNIPYVIPD